MNKQKGFTIIELIVVIAIIAVLAGIVLVNVTSYINKGKDAAAKGNMTTMLTNAAVYFNENPSGTGDGFLGSVTYFYPAYNALIGSNMSYSVATSTNSNDWCVKINLKVGSNQTFCVDGTGAKLEKPNGGCSDGKCQ